MNQKTTALFVLSFSLLVLTACGQVQAPADGLPDVDSVQTEEDMPTSKLPADATEISYRGSAQFVTETQSYPCADYAYENEACKTDPNGMVSVNSFYVQIPVAEVNAELLSYLKNSTEGMARQQGENYLVNLGCKFDGGIQGDMYSFSSDLLNSAFEAGTTQMVDFTMSMAQPERGDTGCLSLITDFNSIQ